MKHKAMSQIVLKDEKWQTIRNKLLILCLMVCIVNASPILVSGSVQNKLPDVSALCSFIHVSSFDGNVGLPVAIIFSIRINVVCIYQ